MMEYITINLGTASPLIQQIFGFGHHAIKVKVVKQIHETDIERIMLNYFGSPNVRETLRVKAELIELLKVNHVQMIEKEDMFDKFIDVCRTIPLNSQENILHFLHLCFLFWRQNQNSKYIELSTYARKKMSHWNIPNESYGLEAFLPVFRRYQEDPSDANFRKMLLLINKCYYEGGKDPTLQIVF